MARRLWANGLIGNTPLTAARLNSLEDDVEAALLALARNPEAIFSGTVTRDANGAPTSATVQWPDGSSGVYSGTASVTWPGAINSYTVTHVGDTATLTFTQPMVTRDDNGNIVARPAITVA